MLQFRRDLDLVEHLDRLGYDEFWCGLRTSREFVVNNREYFNRARQAVLAKINENEAAAKALAVTKSPRIAAAAASMPDLDQASGRVAPR